MFDPNAVAIFILNKLKYAKPNILKGLTLPKSTDDHYKIGKLPFGCVRDFLMYAHLAYKRVEEDWYWDEKLQQYMCRNCSWLSNKKEL